MNILGLIPIMLVLRRILALFVFAGILTLPTPLFAQAVRLAWDLNPDPDVAGYRLYIGFESQNYVMHLDIANVSSFSFSNLQPGATYYFALTAVSASGLESPFSEEVETTIPPRMWIPSVSMQGSRMVLYGTGIFGKTYWIEASEDLAAWRLVGQCTVDFSGQLSFEEANFRDAPFRFYRVIEE